MAETKLKPQAIINNAKCRVYLGSMQNDLTDSTPVKVNFDTETYDPGSNYDTVNKRFVAPVTGYYQVNLALAYSGASTIGDKRYRAYIYVNGAFYSAGEMQIAITGSSATASVADVVYCEAGQYIEGYAMVSTGANTIDIYGATPGGSNWTFMSIHLLSV